MFELNENLKIKKELFEGTVIYTIDDFYKTLKERKIMSQKISKLFLTRGVPGTHDTKLLYNTINTLRNKTSKKILIPRFDKSSDERLKENIEYVGKSNGHKVYTWDWNDKAKELGINDPTKGVIAQEVMEYMPEAVSKDANGYYMVNYGAL